MEDKKQKQEKLSIGERLEMHCKLRRAWKLHTDTDELPLPMLPSVVEKLKKNANKT